MRIAIIVIIVVSILLIVGISIAQKDSQQSPDKSANVQDKPKEIIGKDGAKMLLIPAGEFLMGTDSSEIPELVKLAKQWFPDADSSWFEDETPRHTVSVDASYMDAYEVTNAQYKKFVQATGHSEPVGLVLEGNTLRSDLNLKPWNSKNYNGDNQPVVCVTWEDAKAYAEWAGKRLPTEAEWEYAARGELADKRYVWGDDWPPPKNSGNFADESYKKAFPGLVINGYDDGYAYSAPIGSFKSNGYGLYDMAGNVWEWCADWYGDKYYDSSPKQNPNGPDVPDFGSFHVLRGGSWYYGHYDTYDLCIASRHFPAFDSFTIGFRCVVSVTP